jgi:hypothetical protein
MLGPAACLAISRQLMAALLHQVVDQSIAEVRGRRPGLLLLLLLRWDCSGPQVPTPPVSQPCALAAPGALLHGPEQPRAPSCCRCLARART